MLLRANSVSALFALILRTGFAAFVLCFVSAIGAAAEEQTDEVRIGLLVALTGDAASMGNTCRNGFEAARRFLAPGDENSGRKFSFIYGDSRGEGRTAVDEFQKLTAVQGAAAILTHQSQPTMQINPLAAQHGIPILAVVAHQDFLTSNPYAFRFWPSTFAEAAQLADAVDRLGLRRIAAVSIEDEYTLSLRDQFAAVLERSSKKLVADERIQRNENDFLPTITRLKAAKPDALLVNIAVGQLVSFVKKCREMKLEAQILGNFWFMNPEVMQELRTDYLQGVIFARLDPDRPNFRKAVEEARISEKPTPVMYACFAELAAVFAAVKNIQGPVTPSAVYQGLSGLRSVSMPDEIMAVSGREADFPISLKQIKDGEVQPWAGK